MAAVQGEIDEAAGPPSDVPLSHFVVATVFLLAGTVVGLLVTLDRGHGYRLAHLHASLAGWVCITIMGAMTQFVPVWSDRELYSRKLSVGQLPLVAVGVAGMSASAAFGKMELFYLPGALAVLGFWLFAYNVSRTLLSDGVEELDVTEMHLQAAALYAVLATTLGLALAVDFRLGFLSTLTGFERSALVSAHVSLAVYGFVLTTIAGAIYQLTTMFTQTELTGSEISLQRLETAVYPVSPAALALGYVFEIPWLVLAGTTGVVTGFLFLAVVVARKLWVSETDVVGHPMLARYAVATPILAAWTAERIWTTVSDGRSVDVLGGTPVSHLLLVGFVSVVVVGTLYHVVPFLIWIHRYSDLLGYEKVPLVDDLYSSRAERAELALTVTGIPLLVSALYLDIGTAEVVGGAVVGVVYLSFTANVLYTVQSHQPGGVAGVIRVSN